MLRLLVVDDSALMRRHLRQIFEAEGDFRVELARNGQEALQKVRDFEPDVVTLDVNMPEMDGLSCLEQLMAVRPTSVVMVSSLTEAGAEVTMKALELGAVDFVAKPDGTVSLHFNKVRPALVEKVRVAARVKPRRARGLQQRLARQRMARPASPARGPSLALAPAGLVLVGVSTGGPRTLEEILPKLPESFPWPVLVAQHMPESFTGVFARRMDAICPLEVVEVDKSMPIQRGRIYIGRGDADLVVERRFGRIVASSVAADASLWHPSVDRLVATAMDILPASALVGVQLTGMGSDGAAAMTELHHRGGRTIAESEKTAVVFGMPHELIQRGGASLVRPCDAIANTVIDWIVN